MVDEFNRFGGTTNLMPQGLWFGTHATKACMEIRRYSIEQRSHTNQNISSGVTTNEKKKRKKNKRMREGLVGPHCGQFVGWACFTMTFFFQRRPSNGNRFYGHCCELENWRKPIYFQLIHMYVHNTGCWSIVEPNATDTQNT